MPNDVGALVTVNVLTYDHTLATYLGEKTLVLNFRSLPPSIVHQ
jgi:hypothetical protein